MNANQEVKWDHALKVFNFKLKYALQSAVLSSYHHLLLSGEISVRQLSQIKKVNVLNFTHWIYV